MTTVPNLPKFIALQKESSVEIIEEQPCDKMIKNFTPGGDSKII
jgi:hypothetical protein